VLLDGTIENGRDPDNDGDVEEHIGAHVYGHNRDSLGVCYIGGVDSGKNPEDTRTPEQTQALLDVVSDWMDQFEIPLTRVFGHYEKDPGKACPAFDMGEFRLMLQNKRKEAVSSTVDCKRYTLMARSTYDQCVEKLQRALNKWSREVEGWRLGCGPLKIDGRFGRLTQTRVVGFQSYKGLTPDRIVGPKTWEALEPYL